MKTEILFVKSLEDYLENAIKPIIIHPLSLKSGRPYKNIKLRPREILGAFLICLIIRHISNQDWTIIRDPEEGDGAVWCRDESRKDEAVLLEQVYARIRPTSAMEEINEKVRSAIQRKTNKGRDYARNRHLIVFLDVEGLFDVKKVKEFVNEIEGRFDSYWLFAPSSKTETKYVVFLLKAERDKPTAYEVSIESDFRSWKISELGTL